MYNKHFSIIFNSRGRPQHIQTFLQNLVNTTSKIEKIEVWIGLDKDDPTLIDSLNVINQANFNLKSDAVVNYLVKDRPTNLIHALNILSHLSDAPYVLVANDDITFETVGWDLKTFQTLATYESEHPDGILYGRTKDLSVDRDINGKYAAFPIISKKAIETLGWAIHDRYYSLGGDVATYRIYEKLNRVIDVPLTIKHTLHQTLEQVMNPDLTAFEMRYNTYQHECIDWKTYDVRDEVWKLQHYINNFNK